MMLSDDGGKPLEVRGSLAIFDLDNTLIDRAASFRRWAGRFVAAWSLGPAAVEWLVDADGDGFVPRPDFVSAVWGRYGVEVSLSDFRAQIVESIEVDPRVPASLDRLRGAGWRLAVATNGSTGQQMAKIRRAGLDAYVDAVAISEEVGARKPDRRIFEVAAERCGVRLADGGWMIGDSAAADVVGGQRAGLRTVWIRRGREWDAAGPAPDAIVDDAPTAVAVLLAGG
jgi:putative hydrolase of the HAD superfamily